MQVEILIRVFRVVLTKKKTFEQRHKGDEGIVKWLSEEGTNQAKDTTNKRP